MLLNTLNLLKKLCNLKNVLYGKFFYFYNNHLTNITYKVLLQKLAVHYNFFFFKKWRFLFVALEIWSHSWRSFGKVVNVYALGKGNSMTLVLNTCVVGCFMLLCWCDDWWSLFEEFDLKVMFLVKVCCLNVEVWFFFLHVFASFCVTKLYATTILYVFIFIIS